jgi:hypothetical protein
LLAGRLAVRRRSQFAAQLVLAAFIIAVALTYKFAPYGLVVLTFAVAAMIAAQSLLHWLVRRTDRRLGESLPRRWSTAWASTPTRRSASSAPP